MSIDTSKTPITKSALFYAYFISIRPKTLSASVVPVFVGTFLIDTPLIEINWTIATIALLCALSIQIGTNLTNDVMDVASGVDSKMRLGPLRGLQSGILSSSQVYYAGMLFFGLALLLGIPLSWKGGPLIGLYILISVILSYLYTGGPFPLSYLGYGDPMAFLFYGFFNTIVCYYLQADAIHPQIVLAAIQMGFFPTAIIAINNFRDRDSDKKSGKLSLAVYFGDLFSRIEITLCLFIPFILNLIWLFGSNLRLAPLLSMTTCFFSFHIINRIRKHPPSQLYNRFLAETGLLQLLFWILFLLGFRLEIGY